MLAAPVRAVLYAVPASHPCAAVEAALRLKGIPYERRDMVPLASHLAQRRRFGRGGVPAVVLPDGARVVGSRAIMRALEERAPEPPLLPAGEDERAVVARAEEWGDEVLQPLARRVILAALRRCPRAMPSYGRPTRLPLPPGAARLAAPLMARAAVAARHAEDVNVRADLAHLDSHLRRVEGWIDRGVLGGEAANAADLQIGASLRLLLTIEDVAAVLDPRPAGALARRWFPDYPGRVPRGALPAAWLEA
jgi:glutathione S-transferase